MFHNGFILQEGAFIVADAHYSLQHPQLLAFMEAINTHKLQPTQLIFLGDTFDLLFGEISVTVKANKKIIQKIQEVAQKIEVVFFEGNHDFSLEKVFPTCKVYTMQQQPVLVKYRNKKILFSHGDFDAGYGYRFYSAFIRNRYILKFLNKINRVGKGFITHALERKLSTKQNCNSMEEFETYIRNRFAQSKYRCDYFIDGHYHQNKNYTVAGFEYINLGAFACNQRYFSVKFFEDKELLEEFFFLKG